ncbi:MAG TPA: hypothetical protein VFX41_11375 [Actinomycetales bacterium]|nr:hypothetical protein [Actinomycetales bacterium]
MAAPAGRVALHLGSMCIAMCLANWLMLTLFLGSLAGVTLSGFRQDFPTLATLVMTAVLGAAMAVPMRLMKMAWRPTLEMAGSSVAAGVVLIAGFWLGLVPEAALIPASCCVACVAMIAVVLLRLPLYTSSHAATNA